MIKEKTPITLPEVIGLIGDSEKAEKMKSFVKEFNKMKLDKSKQIKEDLASLDLHKLNEEHIVSLVNFMPADAQDVVKVLEGVSLDQEEINKILEVLKK